MAAAIELMIIPGLLLVVVFVMGIVTSFSAAQSVAAATVLALVAGIAVAVLRTEKRIVDQDEDEDEDEDEAPARHDRAA